MEIAKPRGWIRFNNAVFCIALSLIAACGASASVRAARSGDRTALQSAIARERAEGKLDRKRVRAIAREVATREITEACIPDVFTRIEEARVCTRALEDALERRASGTDEAAAAARLALLDGDPKRAKDGETLVRRYGGSPSPLFRAVAARASGHARLTPERTSFYRDPDERVRLAALRAALEAPHPADAPALIEAARLDPNPVAQGLAARALGGIANPDVVLALRDLYYAGADEGLRQSIVDAWGRREAFGAGGLRELTAVADNQEGSFAIEAGAVLLRLNVESAASASGKRAILRGISRGLARDRVLAIANAKVDDSEMREALRKAAATDDLSVKTAALSRLLEFPATRAEALAGLQKAADGGAKAATFALARARDQRALQAVEKELSSPDREARLAAGILLVELGDFTRSGGLLADAEAGVRMRFSCSVLAAH